MELTAGGLGKERLRVAKPACEAATSGYGSRGVGSCSLRVLASHRKCLQRQKAGEENEGM